MTVEYSLLIFSLRLTKFLGNLEILGILSLPLMIKEDNPHTKNHDANAHNG
jgi:hypothetical protein